MLGAAVGTDGLIYVLGGCAGLVYPPCSPSAVVEAYDVTTRAWATLPPMKTMRAGLVAAAGTNGQIFAVGGEGSCSTSEAFDPITGTWAVTASQGPSSNACWSGVATGPDGRIYTLGGGRKSGFFQYDMLMQEAGQANFVRGFFPGSSTWGALPNLNYARIWSAGAAGPDGRIYSFGGNQPGTSGTDNLPWAPLTAVEVYDPAVATWVAGPSVVCTGAMSCTPACPYAVLGNNPELLASGAALTSCDGRFKLTMQADGNLVLAFSGTTLWQSSTSGNAGAQAHIYGGDLVVYKTSSIWQAPTQNVNFGAWLGLQNDGNLLLFANPYGATWWTGTGGH
jgi:hypothetical protein